jgi:acetyltransferase-like isoleucine patch superfamily enzyme
MLRNVYNAYLKILNKKSPPLIMSSSFVSRDSFIGNYTYIGAGCYITKSHIGRYSSIANYVSIGPGEHDYNEISTSSLFYSDAYEQLTKDMCVVGHDVWIGVSSIVRRGITIGNGAVIGANSFVNQDIPDFAIAAGSPAKVIKYRFTPEEIEKINYSRWWDFDIEEASKIIKTLKKSF